MSEASKVTIKKPGWQCERCRHRWAPRRMSERPVVCPKCKSPYWDRPKKTH